MMTLYAIGLTVWNIFWLTIMIREDRRITRLTPGVINKAFFYGAMSGIGLGGWLIWYVFLQIVHQGGRR